MLRKFCTIPLSPELFEVVTQEAKKRDLSRAALFRKLLKKLMQENDLPD